MECLKIKQCMQMQSIIYFTLSCRLTQPPSLFSLPTSVVLIFLRIRFFIMFLINMVWYNFLCFPFLYCYHRRFYTCLKSLKSRNCSVAIYISKQIIKSYLLSSLNRGSLSIGSPNVPCELI